MELRGVEWSCVVRTRHRCGDRHSADGKRELQERPAPDHNMFSPKDADMQIVRFKQQCTTASFQKW